MASGAYAGAAVGLTVGVALAVGVTLAVGVGVGDAVGIAVAVDATVAEGRVVAVAASTTGSGLAPAAMRSPTSSPRAASAISKSRQTTTTRSHCILEDGEDGVAGDIVAPFRYK
jgi:hypothetical protein